MAKNHGITIRDIARTPSRIRRLARIARVLTRHGFAHIVRYLHIQRVIPNMLRAVRRPAVTRKAERISAPERLAIVLQELGPTAIKLGQLLSTRPDIIPEDYIAALQQLQDDVEPFDTQEAYAVIERELGRPIGDIFARIDDRPMAAGSIGQVYRARLRGGGEVVVKVKRPGIERIIRDDLDLLMIVARRAERVEDIRPYRPTRMVEELAKSLKRELDFVTEASYTAKFSAAFERDKRVRIPSVHWEYTTPAVLTLERISGIPVSRRAELEAAGVDLSKVATAGADVFMRQYFEMGLFHADPHPGNLLVAEDGTLGIIDFGMVGHLDDDRRRDLGTMLIALVRKDLDLVVDVATEIGAVPDDADLVALKSDLVEMLDKYYGVPIKRVDMKSAFLDAMRVTREHGLDLPQDFVLLGKSFVTITGQATALDPDLNMAEVIRPHATRLLREKVSPARLGRELVGQLWQFANLFRRMPRDLRQFSRKALAGRLQLNLKLRGLEDMGAELDRATNRIVFGLIVAGVVVGSSIVIHAKMKPFFDDIPVIGRHLEGLLPELSIIGFAGYVLAGLMAMVLAVAIWRSGRL